MNKFEKFKDIAETEIHSTQDECQEIQEKIKEITGNSDEKLKEM